VYGSLVALVAPPPHWAGWTWGMIGGCVVTWTAWRVWRVCRMGRGHVEFTKFPYHPGDRVILYFGMSEGGATFERVAFRLHPAKVLSELDVVWRREMLTMAYRPVWVTARTAKGAERAIAFAANRDHERYVRGLQSGEIVRYLASGAGPLGRCRDYLFDTVLHLRDLGIRDRRLEALAHAVQAHEADSVAA